MIKIELTIKEQFKLFLKRMYGNQTLPAEQEKQLEQAFYAAWGQFLLTLNDVHLSTDKVIEALVYWENEVDQYWNKHLESKKNETKN